MTSAAGRETRPLGSGFPSFCVASSGASTRSLSAPIETWIASIDAPRRRAVPGSAPASAATAADAREFRSDGKGWPSRTRPPTRRCHGTPASPSDVHELLEVGHEVLDEPASTVGDELPNPGDERPEADRRDDEVTLRVPPESHRCTAAKSEHAFEFRLRKLGGGAEIGDDLDHPAALHDVAHQLRDPAIDLVVGLVIEPRSILLRIR